MSFKNLGLSDALLKAIDKKGYTTPSPIQQKAIPKILERKDILASAQTGTGKTAGFALPMLQILNNSKPLSKRPVRALILTPTRELAAQVYDDIRTYAAYVDLRSTVIFGGVNANPQIRTLRQGVDILVATPGRLLDLHNQKVFSLANVEMLVLDEADRMLDMGFLRDIKKILALLPNRRQNLLFSATFSKEIKQLAGSFLHHPVLVEATPENSTAEKVEQIVYRTDKSKKTDLVVKLISEGDWKQVLIFTRTKHGANRLSQKLEKANISSSAIHGNKSQGARTKALAGFKSGKVRVLVATDIAARGLDIPLLPHVINYELPNIPEDYVHRIGRTGRAGASGEAISIVSVDEDEYVRAIEKLLGERLQEETIPGFEVTETLTEVLDRKAENKAQNQRGRQNSNRKSNPKQKKGFQKRGRR
ncbi:DEAD/DEAH box helicase [Constantimarinum furrinae]|uniref:DEAD-box ATP-dependent RNA helicase RhpA n=1 Tax=Constantimarinum furrinae TaxID=2562285 RepID=A0A7G8PUS6_9FLAO|nr:DEAD/DEAH box helicase [Constantimarinum furrinae]QNJ98092.1 ATP-dependent RNA helicase RhlE [Constantimarinum furrinae]